MGSPLIPLLRYRYDALDSLVDLQQQGVETLSRFYAGHSLVTQLRGAAHQSVLQYDRQLLALQSREDAGINSQLLVTDQQRSVLQAGGVSRAYTAYGHHPVEDGLDSLLGFNGETLDPVTGHYLLGNGLRAFNPVLMRFNSPDSISPFGRGGLNAYAYCLGDPVNFSDPTGRFADIARLLTSLMGVSNTRLGMSPVILPFELTKKVLWWGGAGQLPPRQVLAAAGTVISGGATFMAGATGVLSAIAVINDDSEAAKTLGFIALGLTGLATISRMGAYLATDSDTLPALREFVANKGRMTTTRAVSARSSRPSVAPLPLDAFPASAPPLSPPPGSASAPPMSPGFFAGSNMRRGPKRPYSQISSEREILMARRKNIRDSTNL